MNYANPLLHISAPQVAILRLKSAQLHGTIGPVILNGGRDADHLKGLPA